MPEIKKSIEKLLIFSAKAFLFYLLFLIGLSFYVRPENVKITNVTSSSVTISYFTKLPAKGLVAYSAKDSFFPFLYGKFAEKGYDDRDYTFAQTKCVENFNKEIVEKVDLDFSVKGDNFNCDEVKVKKVGKYYVHHITLKDLEENTPYFFRVGDGILAHKPTIYSFKTYETVGAVAEPIPIFGRIKESNTEYSNDSIMYVRFRKSEEASFSQVYSSVVNDSGGWYIDGGNVRDLKGNILTLISGNESVFLQGIHKNKGVGEVVSWVFGEFDGAYPDYQFKPENDSGQLKSHLISYVHANVDEEELKFLNRNRQVALPSGFAVSVPPIANPTTRPETEEDEVSIEVTPTPTVPENSSCSCKSMGNCSQTEIKNMVDSCGYGNVAKEVASRNNGSLTAQGMVDFGLCSSTNSACAHNMSALSGTSVSTNVQSNTAPALTYDSSSGTFIVDSSTSTNNGNLPIIEDDQSAFIQTNTDNTQLTLEYYSVGSSNVPIVQNVSGINIDNYSITNFNNSFVTAHLPECPSGGGQICNYTIDIQEIPTDAYINPNFIEACVSNAQCPSENIADYLEGILAGSDEDLNTYFTPDNPIYNEYGEGNEITSTVKNKIENAIKLLQEGNLLPSLQNRLVTKAYADNASVDGDIFYLPEYGIYSFELDGVTLTKAATGGSDITMLYINLDGVVGYQPPADAMKPKKGEDIIISAELFKISVEQKSTSKTYGLKKGLNIVSFDFIPVSKDSSPFTAQDIIESGKKVGARIEYISYFDGGRWIEGLKCLDNECIGTDFPIVPGKGYILKLSKSESISIAAYNLKSSIPLNLSSGWNLIGVHGYPKAYTAKTLIDSINKVEGLTADNVTWYPTSKGRYEGLQVSDGVEYGFDYPVSPSNGYFVRISEFVPKDSSCNSITWHEEGALHGRCSSSQSPLP